MIKRVVLVARGAYVDAWTPPPWRCKSTSSYRIGTARLFNPASFKTVTSLANKMPRRTAANTKRCFRATAAEQQQTAAEQPQQSGNIKHQQQQRQ
jgi:hypothetical protein